MNPSEWHHRLRHLIKSPEQVCSNSLYITVLRAFEIQPNFFCSEEYFRRAGWSEVINAGWIWVTDGDQIVLPPINLVTGELSKKIHEDVWSDLGDFAPENAAPVFLDYEFLHKPGNLVLDLQGSEWRKFRKNIRKFEKRVNELPEYRPARLDDMPSIRLLIERWLNGLKDDDVHGADIMLDYLLNGENRKVLANRFGHLYGINVWDYNHKFFNFRFCVCDPDPELFASEYLRMRFFSDPLISHCWINDGGALDRPGLQKFKESLNPSTIRKMFSWKVKTG